MPRYVSLATTAAAASKSLRPAGAAGPSPHFFFQRVVHSDGSAFVLRVSTPKPVLKLTKDVRNHALWNPASIVLDDRAAELSKFADRYGDLSAFDDPHLFDEAAVVMKKKPPPPPAAGAGAGGAASGGGKKKK
ncbi:hypothetical protein HDU83_000698 [Entophlyctis luteolus]|nr:hypothetical protein HDU83_000698 [Entophlyctis luteolus]